MPKAVIAKFLIDDAARLCGLSRSMLDYLCRQEVLVPTGRGRRGRGCPREYSFGDVVMLRVLARLLNAGVSVERLRKALKTIRRYHKDIRPDSLPAQYLVTDGENVYLLDRDRLHDLDGSGQASFLFVLELGTVQQEVRYAVNGR